MKILLKYPTRGRPQQFLTTLKGWLKLAAKPDRITVLVTCDADDDTMTPEILAQASAMHPHVICAIGNSKTKIEACNADIDRVAEWDVVLLISDDMWCSSNAWDDAIETEMRAAGPDGCLWFSDGTRQSVICTLSCVGRDYYDAKGCLYHPSYSSFFCDNEFTEVATGEGKMRKLDYFICTHQHPSWNGGMKRDETYARNNRYWKQDEANYHRRKANGFPA